MGQEDSNGWVLVRDRGDGGLFPFLTWTFPVKILFPFLPVPAKFIGDFFYNRQGKYIPLSYNSANILAHGIFFMNRWGARQTQKNPQNLICLGPRCLFKKWTVVPPIYWRSNQYRHSCFSYSNLPLIAYCKNNRLLICLKQEETEIVFLLHKNGMFKWQIAIDHHTVPYCSAPSRPTLFLPTIYL
jgi:hypothetical protein